MAVALAVLAAAGLACSDAKQPPVAAGPTAADSAEQFMLGVGYFLTTRGVKRGHLVADTAYVYDDQNRFDFRRAKVDFSEENGAPSGTMRALRRSYGPELCQTLSVRTLSNYRSFVASRSSSDPPST